MAVQVFLDQSYNFWTFFSIKNRPQLKSKFLNGMLKVKEILNMKMPKMVLTKPKQVGVLIPRFPLMLTVVYVENLLQLSCAKSVKTPFVFHVMVCITSMLLVNIMSGPSYPQTQALHQQIGHQAVLLLLLLLPLQYHRIRELLCLIQPQMQLME